MRKSVTDMTVVYEQIDVGFEEGQHRLNEMFDVLFEETLKFLNENRRTGDIKVFEEGRTRIIEQSDTKPLLLERN